MDWVIHLKPSESRYRALNSRFRSGLLVNRRTLTGLPDAADPVPQLAAGGGAVIVSLSVLHPARSEWAGRHSQAVGRSAQGVTASTWSRDRQRAQWYSILTPLQPPLPLAVMPDFSGFFEIFFIDLFQLKLSSFWFIRFNILSYHL